MKKKYKIVILINIYRVLPCYLLSKIVKNRQLIWMDVYRWSELQKINGNNLMRLGFLLTLQKEFRNLFYRRLGSASKIIFRILFKPLDSLYINTSKIGGGLYIQHGFSTIIAAKSIGENCYINQQVTIGFEGDKNPIIGNNVRVCAGAKVIGGVSIGDNSIIAAGAVVVKDIPPNEVWGGVPAKFIKSV